MTFVTPALLAGTLLIGLPIVLHLVMRREPQRVLFPALRFLQVRRASNQTRLRLRHLLLLALRCAIILLLALALARPTIRGSGKLGGKDAPIAAVLLFDNSLRMQYTHQNRSRLDDAKELADWLLDQLPVDAPIAVLTRSNRQRNFAVDRGAAQMKVSRLRCESAARPLEQVFRDAIALLTEKEDYRGEIYVFTDLAAATWNPEALFAMRESLEQLPSASVYLLDVGVEEARNLGLDRLQLSGEVLTKGSNLEIVTNVLKSGQVATLSQRLVELHLQSPGQQQPQKRAEQLLGDETALAKPVRFSLASLESGTHQGYVRITGEDALSVDDSQYFTVEVRPPRDVLLVAGGDAQAVFVREALSPSGATILGPPQFKVQTFDTNDISQISLAEFQAVCLLDPGFLPVPFWNSLVDYVRDGGGVGIFLGREATGSPFAESPAMELLPGKLRWQSHEETYLRPVNFDHPVLRAMADYAESIPWSSFPVFQFWELEDVFANVYVVASYANGKPAILERNVGGGRVLTMTTPVSDAAYQEPWNLLPTGSDPWPFLVLMEEMVDYLAKTRNDRLNYRAGQTAVVRDESIADISNCVLRLPGGQSVRQSTVPGAEELVVTATTELGNYRLQAGGESGQLDLGFSVNPAAETSALQRIPLDQITAALGQQRVQLARTTAEIDVKVGLGRVGRELFPWLIFTVAMVLGAEHLLANRFYRRD